MEYQPDYESWHMISTFAGLKRYMHGNADAVLEPLIRRKSKFLPLCTRVMLEQDLLHVA